MSIGALAAKVRQMSLYWYSYDKISVTYVWYNLLCDKMKADAKSDDSSAALNANKQYNSHIFISGMEVCSFTYLFSIMQMYCRYEGNREEEE